MNEQQKFLSQIQFYSAYSRLKPNGQKETYQEMIDRVLLNPNGLFELGDYTEEEKSLIKTHLEEIKSFGSARFLWIGGTEWLGRTKSNHFAPFNCISMDMDSIDVFGYSMDLSMQGCGVGQVIELDNIDKLPIVTTKIDLTVTGKPGDKLKEQRTENTVLKRYEADVKSNKYDILIEVGDSRKGWCDAYQKIINIAFGVDGLLYQSISKLRPVKVIIDLSNIRPYGEVLNGFGGMANPSYIGTMFANVSNILNQSIGRKLNSLEVILILDEAAKNTVSGNIRRSAGMKQGSNQDICFTTAKDNLWVQDNEGNWSIDPKRDALRMSNHTTVYHTIPDLETIKQSITKQYYSGEGAIMYVPEAIARANSDLLYSRELKDRFITEYLKSKEKGRAFLYNLLRDRFGERISSNELDHRTKRFGLNPCAEVVGNNFRCNLGTVHLSRIGKSQKEQFEAFTAAALQVAPLLKLDVDIERFRFSHSIDPIVLVSATQVNEWFINYFGAEWVYWWLEGRPDSEQGVKFKQEEANILNFWRKTIQEAIQEYCVRHELKIPNRYSGFKPEGSLSFLSGSPGFSGVHFPPSGNLTYTRRKTFLKDDPIALAAIDYGYKVIPGTDCKGENGQLLNDPYDPRVKTWLLEIPVKESILDTFPELQSVNFNQISALAQFDWLLQLQQNYSTHNTSYTLNFRKDEIDELSKAVHNAIIENKGYVSMAMLARPNESQTFPRMPFENITLEQYNQMSSQVLLRRKSDNFEDLIKQKLNYFPDLTSGEVACSSEICEIRVNK